MSSIFYMTRNGNKYAYESVSKYVKGRKSPKTIKTYLGKVNPETGEIIPKLSRSRPKEEFAKCYGTVQVLDGIQKKLHLYDDLESVFGTMAPNIMGAAMALAISPTSMDSLHYTVEGSVISEKYKLRGTLSPSTISTLSQNLGGMMTHMDQFFTKRIERKISPYYSLDLTSISSYSHMGGWAEWGYNRDGENLKQTNIAMVTDAVGIPTMFRMLPGSIADISIMKSMVSDMKRLGCLARMVMDSGFESPENILHLLELGVDFCIHSNVKEEAIKKLISMALSEMKKPETCKFHDGFAYKSVEFEVGINKVKDKLTYIIKLPDTQKNAKENNELYEQSPKIKAFVIYDPKTANDNFQNVMQMVYETELEYENTKRKNPEKTYRKLPAFVRKFLDYYVDENGYFHLTRKQNAFSFSENRSGIFVMFTSLNTTFEEMMSSYDVREWVEKAYDVYKSDLDGGRSRTGNPECARGRFFIKFLSLILRIELQNTLRKHDEDVLNSTKKRDSVNGMTVNNVLLSLGTLYAIGNVGDWRLTAVTKNVREIYNLFGLEEPESGQIILA